MWILKWIREIYIFRKQNSCDQSFSTNTLNLHKFQNKLCVNELFAQIHNIVAHGDGITIGMQVLEKA